MEEHVLGIVTDRAGEHYYLDINTQVRAQLPKLAFDGASKRNKPNLQLGALVYCRLVQAHKDLEPEVTCQSLGKKKDWVTRDGVFGDLKGGYMFECSLAQCRALFDGTSAVLSYLGEKLKYEIAVGMNGRVWCKTHYPEHTILISNAILGSEFLSDAQAKEMIDNMFASVVYLPPVK